MTDITLLPQVTAFLGRDHDRHLEVGCGVNLRLHGGAETQRIFATDYVAGG